MRDHERRPVVALTALAAGVLLSFAMAGPAFAHEQRTVGSFNVEVGWGDEPTYAGFKNSVQLIIKDAGDQPVTDLGDSLKVEVKSGDQTMTLPLEPDFSVGDDPSGEPGDYRAWLIPTAPGTYSFHFTGTIHGEAVDQTFTSSDTTFDDVGDPASIEFPSKDPTTGQLADRLDRETARLGDTANAAASKASKAKDDAARIQLIAIAGLVVAVGALAVAIIAVRRRRTA
jgi:hypothetical protein